MMNLENLLKTSGVANENFSPTKNQHGDVERMFQGYPQNPYIAQQSEAFDNLYYPGYMPSSYGYGLKFTSSGQGYGDHSYGSQHDQSPHNDGYGEVHPYGLGGHSNDHTYSQHNHPSQPSHPSHPSHPSQHSHHSQHSQPSQPRHKSKVNTSAISALTLLAFLFFLNILQSCLKEHMLTMNPTVMVMTGGAFSRVTNQRTVSNDGYVDAKNSQSSDYKIFSRDEDVEIEVEPEFIKSENPYDKFFNESNIKTQNANHFYRRKPHNV